MTSAAEARIFRISVGVHLALILILCAGAMVRGCRSSPRRETTMFVSIQDLSVTPEVVDATPEPVAPIPPPPKPDIPEPPKTPVKPKPKPVQVSTVRVTRTQAPAPKPRPSPKPPTEEELRAALSKGPPLGPVGPSAETSGFPFGWYFSLVRQAMYEAWDQPGGLAASSGLRVIAELRVSRDGTILRREIIRPSGHALMDESVRKAIHSVSKLPALPDGYSGTTRDIQIAFELTEGGF